jgi:hypothetical protein
MTNKYTDGQHRDDGAGTADNGQRTKRSPGTEVGQNWGGGADIRTPSRNADIDTEVQKGRKEVR